MANGKWQGSTRQQRLPKNWPQIRRQVFRTFGDICHVCGKPGANQVDHVIAGDDHSLDNLRPIHDDPCHRRKSAAEGGNAAWMNRPRIKRKPEKHPGLI